MNRKPLTGACSECGMLIEFPADSIGLTVPCPYCGKPTELLLAPPPTEPAVPRRMIVWTVIAGLILAFGLAACLLALNLLPKWMNRTKAPSAEHVRP